jgi:hypothetical protein
MWFSNCLEASKQSIKIVDGRSQDIYLIDASHIIVTEILFSVCPVCSEM